MLVCDLQVKVHRYWPGKQPTSIGNIVLEMTNEATYEDYVMREFKLTSTTVCEREVLWRKPGSLKLLTIGPLFLIGTPRVGETEACVRNMCTERQLRIVPENPLQNVKRTVFVSGAHVV